MLDRCN